LQQEVTLELSKSEYLNNEDEIKYKWKIDKEASTVLNCKFKYENGSIIASGLEVLDTFDIFEDLNVVFDGTSPNCTVKLEYQGDELDESAFVCSQTEGLKNGDTVEVSLNLENIDSIIESANKIPEKSKKKYKVKNIDEYVSDFAELPEDFLSTIYQEAEDTIAAYAAKTYSENISIADINNAGYILDVSKKDGENSLYIIYSATLVQEGVENSGLNLYYPVEFKGVCKTPEGISYNKNAGIAGMTEMKSSFVKNTKGYANKLTCYRELGKNHSDKFDVSSGGVFEGLEDCRLATGLSDLSEDFKTTTQERAIQVLAEYESDRSFEEMEDLQYVGDYFLYSKKGEKAKDTEANEYYVVFSATIAPAKSYRFQAATVYFPVKFNGINVIGDGECVAIEGGEIMGECVIDRTCVSNGFTDGKEMFGKLITANRQEYKYEVSEELKQFGE
jgi:hypothetical protein